MVGGVSYGCAFTIVSQTGVCYALRLACSGSAQTVSVIGIGCNEGADATATLCRQHWALVGSASGNIYFTLYFLSYHASISTA